MNPCTADRVKSYRPRLAISPIRELARGMATAIRTKPSVAELVEAALRAGDPVALQQLREQIPCSASTLTKTLSKLVADGVVERPARGVYQWVSPNEDTPSEPEQLIPAARDGIELEREPALPVAREAHTSEYVEIRKPKPAVAEREPVIAAAVITEPVGFETLAPAPAEPEPAAVETAQPETIPQAPIQPAPAPAAAQPAPARPAATQAPQPAAPVQPQPIPAQIAFTRPVVEEPQPNAVKPTQAVLHMDTGAVPVRERRFVVRAFLIVVWAFLTGFALFAGGGIVGAVVSVVALAGAVMIDRFLRSYYQGGVIPPVGRKDRFA